LVKILIMRIGFDAKRAFFNFTGLGNYSRTVIRQLTTFYPGNNYILYNPGKISKLDNFPPPNCIVVQPETFFYQSFPSLWRSFGLPGILSRERIDIFHGLSNELPFGINDVPAKKVVTIHDLIFLRYPRIYKRADREIYKRKFRYSAKVADRIIAISEQTKRDIHHFLNIDYSRIEVIYQDCSPVFHRTILQEELDEIKRKYFLPPEYILFVGTIEERKNLLNILKAISAFRIEMPLVVVGKETRYMKEIVKYISEAGILNIYFLKNLPEEDLPAIYANSSLFVYPSFFEGFGIPVLEALNAGTPVITSRGSCLEETGGKAAIYIDPYNIEELGDSMLRVLNDKELRGEMIEEGKKHATIFRPERTTKQLIDLYKSLI